jgi:ligand-binding sensor domain-containing protein/signal transduction histidine kinase
MSEVSNSLRDMVGKRCHRAWRIGVTSLTYRTLCVGLLAASLSFGVCAEPEQSGRLVRLPVVDGHDLRFVQLGPAQDQLQDEVNRIVQDDEGFMWFGTSDGLRRYDGYGFRAYRHDPKNPNSISGATVYSLFKDRSGKLWVGSDAFLDMFDPATDKFTHLSGPGSAGISSLVLDVRQDRSGMLWVASYQGLYRIDPTTLQAVCYRRKSDDPFSLSSNLVKATFEERDGTFWVVTERGLDLFNRDTGRVMQHISLMNGVEPLRMSLFQDRAGALWAIFSSKNGLALVDRAANRVTQYSFDDGSGQNTGVDSIYEDNDGNLWLGTGSSGLLKLDRDRTRFVRYRSNPRDPESFGAGIVLAICEDREGSIWAGTRGGVTRFDRRQSPFQTYRPRIGSSVGQDVELSASVFEDSHGVLWIGSQAVRNRIEGKAERVSYYGDAESFGPLLDSAVRSITEDRSGLLWFGTYAGLDRIDTRTRRIKKYQHNSIDPQSLSNNNVPSLFVDHKGVLWVGTMDGLDSFDPATDRFRSYRASGEGLNQYQVIAEDSHGALWLGTEFTGLQRLDPSTGHFTIYRNRPGTPNSLSNDNVAAICIDASGIIWIGTQNGLNRFDPATQTFTAFYQHDGLPSNLVTGIHEDERGDLWLSSRNRISRFDPHAKTFANYSASDGILRGNIYGPHAGWKSSKGEMFIDSTAGVTAFFPGEVVDNAYVPPVVLTDFQLFGKPAAIGASSPLHQQIAATKSLTLSASENVFSFEFSALSYVSPEENRYRYRLEGLETEWNEISSEHRLVTYTTLPPGDYIFHVQGSNNRGLWNEQGVALSLRILPPWWSTWWFRTILAASLLLSLWYVYYLRIRGIERRQAEVRALNEQLIKAQEAERMRISGELHDSILQNITSLSIRLGTVKYYVPLDPEVKATISGLQNELISIGTDVRQISHELHPAVLQESGLHAALSFYCEEFSKVRGLVVSCVTDESVKNLSPGAALCIYRIAQEALGNAGKYSEATKVEVQLTRSDGRVCLFVSDNGVGCTPDQIGKSGGLGVINMRERVLQLGGTFAFESEPGRGTTVRVEIPFQPNS